MVNMHLNGFQLGNPVEKYIKNHEKTVTGNEKMA